MLGDSPKTIGYGVASITKKKGPQHLFEKFDCQKSDIFLGNLECVVSSLGIDVNNIDTLEMRASPEVIDELKKIGINILSVANNHINQHGPEVYEDTINTLRNKLIKVIGVKPVDGNETRLHSESICCEINGVKLCFAGYSMEKERYYPNDIRYSKVNSAQIIHDVTLLKEGNDHVIVSIHWGDEFVKIPNPEIISIAHKIIDAGASIILGHHPHVIQPVENYNDKIIAYSLGNFVTDMLWNPITKQGILLEIYLDKGGVYLSRTAVIETNEYCQPYIGHQNAEDILVNCIESIPNYNEYRKSQARNNRVACYRYILKNITKYKAKLFLQMIGKVLKNIID